MKRLLPVLSALLGLCPVFSEQIGMKTAHLASPSSSARSKAMAECAKIFEAEMRDRVIHGAAVVSGGVDGETLSGSWGWADAAHTVPMSTRTVIDVASVTKAAAGITAYLVARARGRIDLDAPFTNCLPAYVAPLSRTVTIRDLANHVSGFGEADGKPRVYFDSDASTMLRNIFSLPPAEPTCGKVSYSCRNYVLLGQVFESALGCRVADFCRSEIFLPVGMNDTSLGAPLPSVGPGRLAQTMGTDGPGVISDYVARPLWAAGIGTFNAGMFSTAEDLAKLMRVYLRGGVCDDGTRLFGPDEMMQIAPSPTNRIDGARAFGWQCAASGLPKELTGTSLFHSGWSGQTVLFDLRRRRYAVVLTTRCGDYKRAKKDRFKAVAALMGCVREAAETVLSPSASVTTDGDALPGQGVERLTDGEINPTCAWRWEKKPIRAEFDFGEAREVGGVRFTSGRSWVNCGVRMASFYGDGKPLAEHVAFRLANTYKESYATWKPSTVRRVTMVIEDTYDFKGNYYSGYTHAATPLLPKIFETPPYPEFSGKFPTVQIAEMSFFGKETPADLPLPNKDGSIAYPESRLVRDWLYQSCVASNISHLANVEADTTKPDPMGEDLSAALRKTGNGRAPAFLADRAQHRREFLAAFRKEFTQFVYVKHIVMGNSIFHATDDLTDASYQEWKKVPDYTLGGSQLVLATLREEGSISQEVLIDKPHGYIRDPNLHFDGKTLVFSMRENLTTSNYHLFSLDLETRALKQLTFDGLVCAADVPGQKADFLMPASDIEPCWLPDGSIVFQSTRCSHSVDCWPLPVSNLFRCDADGSRIRRLGFDQVQTFFPQLMDDGRVSYTRWEYNDRNAAGIQQLYAMNPDGTKQTGLFANNSEFPFSLIHTRGIPGTRDIMMISCGHHVGQKGRLAMSRLAEGDDYTSFTYDPAKSVWGMNTNAVRMTFPGNRVLEIPWSPWDNPSGPATTNIPGMHYVAGAAMNAAPGVQPARQPHDYHYNVYDMHSQFGPQWAYPFPLGGGKFLVSFMPEGCRYYRGPYSSRFGVYAMDETGRRELLAFDWGQHCMQPIPVKRRTPPPRPLRKLDYREGFGTYYVQDVYAGAAMVGAPKGCVKRLRVIGLEYRPVHIGWNWQYGWHSTQGKIGTPIAVGNGAYDVKHVLGEADVEADGSCSFRAPARTPVYFQLIDKDGCCIQTMRSWSTLQPGEVNGCIGCHEHPHQAGVDNAKALALRRPPQRLKPWLPGGETHPFVAALEKDGPLASLDSWMGLNRTKAVVDTDQNDGFSFSRLVQPILDAKCVSCHDGTGGKAPAAMDLRGTRGQLPPSDDKSKRKYSTSYLALTYKGKCNEKVNFAHGLGFAPFKPPYSFGSARSGVWRMLQKGHGGARLTDAEKRLIACWIDLAVPFCGSYVERNDWNDWYRQRYEYISNKRAAFAWAELNDVRREYGMPPVPLTGFIPNVAEPRKQNKWDE